MVQGVWDHSGWAGQLVVAVRWFGNCWDGLVNGVFWWIFDEVQLPPIGSADRRGTAVTGSGVNAENWCMEHPPGGLRLK